MKKTLLVTGTAWLMAVVASMAAADTWVVDPVHSGVAFKIRNFFSKVPGHFSDFKGSIVYDPEKPELSRAEAVIQVSSIDTDNKKRDDHLRSPDFFDAAKNPAIVFTSTAWRKTGDNQFEVAGNLTMLGKTKPITLKVTLLGVGPGRQGSVVSGWEATGTLKRSDWGMTAGLPAVSDEVDLNIDVQAIRQ